MLSATSTHLERRTQLDAKALDKRVVGEEQQGCPVHLLLTENGGILAALGSGLKVPAHITYGPLVNVKWKVWVCARERSTVQRMPHVYFSLTQRTKLTLLTRSLSTSERGRPGGHVSSQRRLLGWHRRFFLSSSTLHSYGQTRE